MKIVVIGGSGLIGTKLSAVLKQKGHEVVSLTQFRRQHHHTRGAG